MNMEKEAGYKDIPIGGVIDEPGTALKYETGGWRSSRPQVDKETCTNCMQCWFHCPDVAINAKDGQMTGFDLNYCKGCGICASVCPVDAIDMMKEE